MNSILCYCPSHTGFFVCFFFLVFWFENLFRMFSRLSPVSRAHETMAIALHCLHIRWYFQSRPGAADCAWWQGSVTDHTFTHSLFLLYKYNMVWFQPVKILAKSKLILGMCVSAILPDSKGKVEKELKMRCQNFDKQGPPAMKAIGKNETKNLRLEFHPRLIWQQSVASAEVGKRLESTTWPGWHLFTGAGSQLLAELAVSYSNQRIAFISRHF